MHKQIVSVVIPTYNMSRFLPEAIQSILDQTYRDFELIIVDDGSTDDTGEVVKKLAETDSRIRYHFKENGGEANTRNAGIELSQGDFIAFNDADDIWYATKLEKQMELFDREPSPDVVITDRDLIDEAGQKFDSGYRIELHRGNEVYKQLLIENFVPMSSPVVRRDVFERVGVFDETLKYGTDREFWLRASVQCRFDFVPEPLEAHRKWGNQMTTNQIAFAEAGLVIIQRFFDKHPSLITKKIANETWSAAYHRRGRVWGSMGEKASAFRDLAYSIWRSPSNVSAMKSMLKLAFGRL